MRSANLAARFALELAALAGLAYAGWSAAGGQPARLGLALAAPALFAAVWGAWFAPGAWRRLADPARLALEGALFALVAMAVAAAGATTTAVVFAVAVAVNLALMVRWDQRGR